MNYLSLPVAKRKQRKAKTGKSKVITGLLLVAVILVLLDFTGVFTYISANILGGGSSVEPTTGASSPGPFLVADLSVRPEEVQPNEIVTITVSVANTHDTWGICNLVLIINGVKEAEEQATVATGTSQEVSFLVAREEPGNYNIFVNGLSGTFTVLDRL